MHCLSFSSCLYQLRIQQPVESRLVVKDSMESQLAAANEGGPGVLDKDAGAESVGGERDVYSEDNASEDQRVTPWMRTVAW